MVRKAGMFVFALLVANYSSWADPRRVLMEDSFSSFGAGWGTEGRPDENRCRPALERTGRPDHEISAGC